jgi:hypothetical protein
MNISDGSQHSHVIGRDPVKTLSAGGQSAKDIAAADDDADLNTQSVNVFDFGGDAADNVRVDSEGLFTHQNFTAELQQNAFVLRFRSHRNVLF